MASSSEGYGKRVPANPHPVRIIIDTNALMMPFQFGINIDVELQRLFGFWKIFVPRCVITELEGLSRTNPHAKAGLSLARHYETVDTSLGGDDGVLEALRSRGNLLLTNDKELKGRATGLGYRVIYLRKRSYLVVTGE